MVTRKWLLIFWPQKQRLCLQHLPLAVCLGLAGLAATANQQDPAFLESVEKYVQRFHAIAQSSESRKEAIQKFCVMVDGELERLHRITDPYAPRLKPLKKAISLFAEYYEKSILISVRFLFLTGLMVGDVASRVVPPVIDGVTRATPYVASALADVGAGAVDLVAEGTGLKSAWEQYKTLGYVGAAVAAAGVLYQITK